MASAWQERVNGRLRWRVGVMSLPDTAGARRQLKRLAPPDVASERAARALADSLEDALALLEGRSSGAMERLLGSPEAARARAVELAEEFALLDAGQLLAARARLSAAGLPLAAVRLRGDATVEDAWQAHPSTLREQAASPPREYDRHLADIRRFLAWWRETRGGSGLLRDVSLELVMSYVAAMRGEGRAWSTRRHAIMAIRRACAMAPASGLVNVLGGLKLDADEQPERPTGLPKLADLAALFAGLIAAGDHRGLLACGLMGLCGLRPSEAIRLRIRDFDAEGLTLRVGMVKAKNLASRRVLALPAILAEWAAPVLAGRDRKLLRDERAVSPAPDAPLLWSASRRSGSRSHFISGDGAGDIIPDRAGAVAISPKILRKSFATIATQEAGVPGDIVERFLGHKASGVAAITWRHYLEDSSVEALRPAAASIDAAVRRALAALASGKAPEKARARAVPRKSTQLDADA